MNSKESRLYCSFQANITGIKFYPGYHCLKSCVPVRLHREPGNVHDGDAVMAYIESGSKYVELGHLEKDVAKVLAPMMDSLSGFRCIALVIYIYNH